MKEKTKTASELRLLTETITTDVTSLTSEFGKGSGISWLLWPSSIYRVREGYKKLFVLDFTCRGSEVVKRARLKILSLVVQRFESSPLHFLL